MSQSLTFDVAHLAAAWLSVFQAAGTEASQPAFYKAVAIEWFPTGVRLVSTDQTVLLSAWVPSVDDFDTAPGLDEAPKATTVALDWSQRAKGTLAYAWSLMGKEEDALAMEVTLSIEDAQAEVPQGRLELDVPGGELVVLDVPGKERVRLQIYQGQWPDWRPIAKAFKASKTNQIALNPQMMGRLAKLGRWSEGALQFHFGGVDKVAHVEIGSEPVAVDGWLMPSIMPDAEPEPQAPRVPDYDGA